MLRVKAGFLIIIFDEVFVVEGLLLVEFLDLDVVRRHDLLFDGGWRSR